MRKLAVTSLTLIMLTSTLSFAATWEERKSAAKARLALSNKPLEDALQQFSGSMTTEFGKVKGEFDKKVNVLTKENEDLRKKIGQLSSSFDVQVGNTPLARTIISDEEKVGRPRPEFLDKNICSTLSARYLSSLPSGKFLVQCTTETDTACLKIENNFLDQDWPAVLEIDLPYHCIRFESQ
ncbi:MAG: hypothetical protein V4534_01940 [Myxococcota bacterium]